MVSQDEIFGTEAVRQEVSNYLDKCKMPEDVGIGDLPLGHGGEKNSLIGKAVNCRKAIDTLNDELQKIVLNVQYPKTHPSNRPREESISKKEWRDRIRSVKRFCKYDKDKMEEEEEYWCDVFLPLHNYKKHEACPIALDHSLHEWNNACEEKYQGMMREGSQEWAQRRKGETARTTIHQTTGRIARSIENKCLDFPIKDEVIYYEDDEPLLKYIAKTYKKPHGHSVGNIETWEYIDKLSQHQQEGLNGDLERLTDELREGEITEERAEKKREKIIEQYRWSQVGRPITCVHSRARIPPTPSERGGVTVEEAGEDLLHQHEGWKDQTPDEVLEVNEEYFETLEELGEEEVEIFPRRTTQFLSRSTIYGWVKSGLDPQKIGDGMLREEIINKTLKAKPRLADKIIGNVLKGQAWDTVRSLQDKGYNIENPKELEPRHWKWVEAFLGNMQYIIEYISPQMWADMVRETGLPIGDLIPNLNYADVINRIYEANLDDAFPTLHERWSLILAKYPSLNSPTPFVDEIKTHLHDIIPEIREWRKEGWKSEEETKTAIATAIPTTLRDIIDLAGWIKDIDDWDDARKWVFEQLFPLMRFNTFKMNKEPTIPQHSIELYSDILCKNYTYPIEKIINTVKEGENFGKLITRAYDLHNPDWDLLTPENLITVFKKHHHIESIEGEYCMKVRGYINPTTFESEFVMPLIRHATNPDNIRELKRNTLELYRENDTYSRFLSPYVFWHELYNIEDRSRLLDEFYEWSGEYWSYLLDITSDFDWDELPPKIQQLIEKDKVQLIIKARELYL